MSEKKWNDEQWQAYFRVVDWSHRVAYKAAEKLMRDAGIEPRSSLQVFNIEDNLAHAIMRGAIRVISDLAGSSDSGEY